MKRKGANGEKPVGALPGPDEFAVAIVGESHYADALEHLLGAHEIRFVDAVLVPEPNNPYSADAVRVDIDAKTVGHMSKETTPSYHRSLDKAGHRGQIMRCRAAIRGRARSEYASGRRIGVWLDLPYLIGELKVEHP